MRGRASLALVATRKGGTRPTLAPSPSCKIATAMSAMNTEVWGCGTFLSRIVDHTTAQTPEDGAASTNLEHEATD